jgi:acid phosphatase
MKKKYLSAFFILVIFITGCASGPQNLSVSKREVMDFYKSSRYNAELERVVERAISSFSKVEFDSLSAVIFDIDETALNNLPHIQEVDFGYIPHLWDIWIEERNAPAIKEVKKLYDYLTGKGARIIFITGRKDYQYDATLENLNSEGFTIFDTLITKGKNDPPKAVDYKSNKRIELTNKGYTIKGSVGDQYSDLEGPHSGIKIKIPNYLYSIE